MSAAESPPGNETPAPSPPGLLVPVAPATLGPHSKCPHCGSIGIIEPSDALLFRCGICGKARVPVDRPGQPELAREQSEVPALVRASAAYNASLAWGAGSAVAAGFSLLSLLALALTLSATSPGLFAGLFGLVIALMPALLAVHGVRQVRRLRPQIEPALEEAWVTAAREVVEAVGSVDERQLAKMLRVTPERAEHLLVNLSAFPRDAGVRLVASSDGVRVAPQVRIAGLPDDPAADVSDDEAAALEAATSDARKREAKLP